MAFKSSVHKHLESSASLEVALIGFAANLLAYISSHVLDSLANGVIRE